MVSKSILFQLLLTFIVLNGMEMSGYTIFMFSHFVNDLDQDTAQRDFSIGFLLLWMSAFIINPILSTIVDKTGKRISVIATTCYIKVACLLVYTFSKNVIIIYLALICCMGYSPLLVVYTEMNHMFEPEKRVEKTSQVISGIVIGEVIGCLFRFTPRNFIFKIGPAEITDNTLPLLITAILFSMFTVIFTFVACRHETISISNDRISGQTATKKGKVFVIFLTCFLCRFSSVTMVVAIQEFGENNQIPNVYLGLIFTLRYFIAFAANRLQQPLLGTYCNKNILAVWQLVRITSFALMFLSTFITNTSIQLVFLLLATFLSSISWVNDDAILLPELMKTADKISFYCAVYGLVDGLGICATFLYPLFDNFNELYISIGMVMIALNCFMLQKTGLI